MRILVVVGSITRSGGGVAEVAKLASFGLAERGHDVEIATIKDQFFDQGAEKCSTLTVKGYRAFGPTNFGFSPGLLFGLLRSRADIIHVHGIWMFHCAAVLAWSWVTGGKYVVTPHGMLERWIRRRSPRLKRIVSVLFHNRFLRRASCFQVLTEKEIEDVRDSVGAAPVRLIPNYVEVEPSASIEEQAPWWQPELAKRDIFLYFGRIHEKKGCLELCQAWQEACSRSPEFQARSALVFCGWVDDLPGFEPRVADLYQKLGNAYFAGPQYGSEKESTLAAASFLLLPSKSEGLPMAILEAWSHAKPVLMTKECNLSAAFAHDAAIEIQQDAQSIADNLLSVSELETEARAELGRSGQRFLSTHFSKTTVIDQLTALYADVTSAAVERQTAEHK